LNNWQDGKKWSDKFLPKIKMICGRCLIGEPPIEEDMERNTDLTILNMMPVRIACRIRRFNYFEKYKADFTIRALVPSGNKSELAKIIEGYGDYFFYGFSNQEENNLHAWRLCKLSVFRLWFLRNIIENGKEKLIKHDNLDGSSSFYSFSWSELPKDFIVKEHWND
jgi:hypothetical protein